MTKKFDNVYQFRIELRGIKPPVWRKIIVPGSYTFWDLHVAIQDAMSWTDARLHEFLIKNPKTGRKINIGIPDEDCLSKVYQGWKKKIADFFSPKKIQKPNTPMTLEITGSISSHWKRSCREKKTSVIPAAWTVSGPVRRRTAAAIAAMKISSLSS